VKARNFSEPGVCHGTASGLAVFTMVLQAEGVHARWGGRFRKLSLGRTKSDAIAEIIAYFGPRHTLALGDAPNEIEMLEAAHAGIIVANPAHDPLPVLKGGGNGADPADDADRPVGLERRRLAHIAYLNPSPE